MALGVAVMLASVMPASAALSPGATAPAFTAEASLAGKDFTFVLADALKKGPVVVYFYPSAYTGVVISKRIASRPIGRNSTRLAPPSSACRPTASND